VFVVTPVVVAATRVWAWLAEGHEIVAVIATDELRPSTKSHVAQILGVPADTGSVETAMAASSIRPDTEFRDQDRATVQWHFIEYAFRRRNRICGAVPAGECITAKIDEYAQRLGEGNYEKWEPLGGEAKLCYLEHCWRR
jgi:S1/P1 Nuclease